MVEICSACNNHVEVNWKYCRFCGNSLKNKEKEVTVEIIEDEIAAPEITSNIKETVIFDKELYFKVLSTRTERARLLKKKSDLSGEVKALLEQLQGGLISREYAMPKIKVLKEQVTETSQKQEKFKSLPDQLPVEVLLDQLDDAQARIKKLDKLKDDPAITKEALRSAKKKAEDTINLLKEEYSTIVGHLKQWEGEIKNELSNERNQLEQLYIKMKTGEITEDSYNEKKQETADEIAKYASIEKMLKVMLSY